MKWFVIVFAFIIGCGSRHDDWYYGEMDPSVGEYAHEALYYHWLFKQDCINYTQALCDDESVSFHFVYNFGKMSSHVGEASMQRSMSGKLVARKIAYLTDYWARSTVVQRKTLVYHELGHALLGYGHTPESEKDIMNSGLPAIKEEDWNHYVYKLFNK